MRDSLLPLASLAAASSLLVSPARAAFEDEFALVDSTALAGYYTAASGVSGLGQWSVSFFPAENGLAFVDTNAAPASVTLGASTSETTGTVEDSTTVLFIDLPADGHVSFTIQATNTGTGDFYATAEVYLSGVVLYALTDPNVTYVLDFDAFGGETLEFRTVALAGDGSTASNSTVISNFTLASAIPEPSAYTVLIGLAALGLAARRRRAI